MASLLVPVQHRLHDTLIRVLVPLERGSTRCEGWIFAYLHTAHKNSLAGCFLVTSILYDQQLIGMGVFMYCSADVYSPKHGTISLKDKLFFRILIDWLFRLGKSKITAT